MKGHYLLFFKAFQPSSSMFKLEFTHYPLIGFNALNAKSPLPFLFIHRLTAFMTELKNLVIFVP